MFHTTRAPVRDHLKLFRLLTFGLLEMFCEFFVRQICDLVSLKRQAQKLESKWHVDIYGEVFFL